MAVIRKQNGGNRYKKRQLKKSKRLFKKAERLEKKADEAKAYTKEKYGKESLFVFQPSGKRARRRAEKALNKAKAGSRKAYRKGRKEGIYKTGGKKRLGGFRDSFIVSPPTEI